MLPHPPITTDLDPTNYYLLSRMKTLFMGHRFQSVEDMKRYYDGST
jgi:hypothetical protein